MTVQTSHQIARTFFDALSNGHLPQDLLTDDMTAWTTSAGVHWPKDRYESGIKMFGIIFPDGLKYEVDTLTAEGDRVIAEVQAKGILSNGQAFHNIYVFILRLRDGKIAAVAEHFNPDPVRTHLIPLLQAVMAKNES